MEIDHLERGSRFSRRRPPIRRNLAVVTAALLLIAGAQSAAPNRGSGKAVAAQTPANAKTAPSVDDGLIDGQSEFRPEVVSCDALRPKKAPRQVADSIDTPDYLRRDLHYHVLADIRDFDGARVEEKDWFYALTAVGVILGAIAAFLVAVDFHLYRRDGESTPRPWRKWVVVGLQFSATMVVGTVATFKLTDMWQTRVDGLYQLRNLDSELVAGGCTTDAFDRIVKQVNLIEAKDLDLKGIFSATASQNTSTDRPWASGTESGAMPASEAQPGATESPPGASDNSW